MLARRAYYFIKPFVPWSLRIAFRRWITTQRRRTCADVWPIKEAAGRTPEGWPGWPDGKKFALVLTHDVEGQKGLDRCSPLMELELDLGLRSSFNFIPEGDYDTPKELRDLLTTNGFEVGVHDLRHDGKLYDSRATFRARAQTINKYLKAWNAVGFRSGFMHHNLEWIQELDVLYDASTFDTDPFEPQPDGVNTIFPFWVPSSAPRLGYVELPYTVAQDSTLFVLMKERTIEIWKRKMDWIAQRGGMVLVDTHPDYMNFGGKNIQSDEYDVALYQQFLRYIQDNYKGLYWHQLPAQVAELVHPRSVAQRAKSRSEDIKEPA